jgi:hypothetical protein
MVDNRLSRRKVLTIAASAGVGVSVAGVAGLSLAGETRTTAAVTTAPLVISLRDAAKGTFDVFSGASKTTLTDKKLAAQLLKAVHR